MNEKLLKVLEFDEIRNRLAAYAVSQPAKEQILSLMPHSDFISVQKSLQYTEQAYTVKNKYLVSPICEFDDISEILDKARTGAVLRPGELLKTAIVLRCARIAKSEISALGDDVNGLKEIVSSMLTDRNMEKQITDAIAGENEVKDDASDKLRELRRKIQTTNVKLKEKLSSYTRNGSMGKYLQDNIVTVRMGRFVLPVKSECRSMVPGLIHDQSGSGSTVFIEPFPVVELNNELRYLQMEEQREIERILSVLSEYVANSYDLLKFALAKCTELDVIFAKSAFSVACNGIMPRLNEKGILSLKNARHPLIDREKVVPVSVEVGQDFNMLIVTGPNTGGKTVCLKTVGLCCLMAYSGIMIPCDKESSIAVYDNIFCDLGDEQSIEQSLSTFSAHIVNIVHITDSVTPQSLVLLDELGSGTDPIEGAALSVGILQYLELIGCKGVVTTHFNEVKEYALLSKKLMNACMQFDEKTLSPTYKLMVGIPGVSNALQIAGTLGVNDYILRKAKESISHEHARFENVLRQAQSTKTEVERQREELEKEKETLRVEREQWEIIRKKIEEKREKIESNAKAETNRIIARMLEQADDLMQELKNTLKEENEEALRKARAVYARLDDVRRESEERIRPAYAAFVPEKAKTGQRVIVRSLDSEGEITAPKDKKGFYKVRVGNLHITVKENDIALPIPTSAKSSESRKNYKNTTPVVSAVVEEPVVSEIKLLGKTVSEAIEILEPHILSAQSGSMLRIVHGKGTGALGKGIQSYLKTCPSIASFRYGRYGEGETGVTIAEIK